MADETHDHPHHAHLWPGVPLALGAAILFGVSTPISKLLLAAVDPQFLAGLLYLGAGLGLAAIHLGRSAFSIPAPEAPLRVHDLPWLAAIILFGGVAGPLLLMLGLKRIGGAEGALLLNLEGLATMAIAWIAFRENVDRRLLLGALAILAGALALAWRGQGITIDNGSLLIAGACLAWGIDNNLTRKLSAADPVAIAMTKGLAAGAVNTGIAAAHRAALPAAGTILASGIVGFLSIGVSLVLFILGLRHLGTARTGAYFSTAPFIGAAVAIPLLGEAVTWQLLLSGGLMATGLWLHLTERHEHEHTHEALEHEHAHVHDEHHQHRHDGPVAEPHTHVHRHQPMRHKHIHYPDLHHRHPHG
jgi:drug/metabolite transporter (DMT)-like permease